MLAGRLFQAKKKYGNLRSLVTAIVIRGGTKFSGANLTDADFTKATLNWTDFSNATLTRTRWFQTQGLELTRREMASSYETLDLFHHGEINPTAAAIALKELAENHPEAKLEVLALEGQGREKTRLHIKVTDSANHSQLSTEYFKTYSQRKSLPDANLQALKARIEEKDERIRSLENLLVNANQQPNYYVETYTEGELTMSQSKGNIKIGDVGGNVSGVAAAGENMSMTGVAIGEISGNVTNTINQLPDSSETEGIKELLTQLQAAIETDQNLSNEDKTEALEQVKAIAEAGQKPEDGAMQKIAKRASRVLKAVADELPTATKFVDACTKLLPQITKFFGF